MEDKYIIPVHLQGNAKEKEEKAELWRIIE